ncbi:aminotransferase class III-fold pyridoxal phosphate-dependent enzyme [Actinocorallia sp. API 0066]|uniref:aspartate aminotransferase family protein n=1 Tax=Actinocorallia sp. API 0066 TaxID=2896846 RepID=UPI001E5B7238|nr:aminotransferase class III-fold pyridoxal phosphate-dependent enzyme [Actinocorallia sp. API 0066]MCD0453487.1 aminotransferase class III-fold pyridoxal phosphate-dependent enzyme [Actinocorallia sp. API 0066]
MTDRDDVLKLYERHISTGAARMAAQVGLPVEARAEGATVWDTSGRAYLDCGGYGVFLTGHRHPAIVAALHAQLDRMPLSTRTFLSTDLAIAASRLAAVAPAGLERVYFASSGAEAVETALKLARASGRRRIISMGGGFHGKTLGALTVTDRPVYRQPFRPLLPDAVTVPFGDVEALRSALAADPAKAAVIVEPIQGESGVRIPPDGYLAAVAEACRAHDAYLIVDEIQTGMGRTGSSWWACDREAVVPDLLLAGKSLGGGCVPVSAVIGTPDAFRPLDRNPRLHSSTFGGNPLAVTAVTATIDTIIQESLIPKATTLGETLLAALTSVPRPPTVEDIRGRGLLLAIECTTPAAAHTLSATLLTTGVLTAPPLSADRVVRLSPPATLTPTQTTTLTTALTTALQSP